MEIILVFVILGAAVAGLAGSIRKSFNKGDACSSCAEGGGCGSGSAPKKRC